MVAPPSPPYVGPAAHDSGDGNKPIRRIVIHSTVGPCRRGQARAVAGWFRNPASRGSAHYVCDPGEVVQVVWDSRIAWHAPPNPNSIGVELCDFPGSSEGDKSSINRWDDDPHTRMLHRAARLVAQLCLAYEVPMRKVGPIGLRLGRQGICGHVDVRGAWDQTSHWDPGRFPWKRFIRMVHRATDDLQQRKPEPEPEPVPEPVPDQPSHEENRVTHARADLTKAARHARRRGWRNRLRRIRQALDILPRR